MSQGTSQGTKHPEYKTGSEDYRRGWREGHVRGYTAGYNAGALRNVIRNQERTIGVLRRQLMEARAKAAWLGR